MTHAHRLPLVALGFAAALCFSTFSAAAEASDWTARLHSQWVSSGGELLADEDLDDAFGVYLGAEYRVAERWGIEIGVGHSTLEAEQNMVLSIFGFVVDTELQAEVEVTPLTVAFNYHFLPESDRTDVYLAPVIGWAFLDASIDSRIAFETPIGFPGIPIEIDDVGSIDLEVDDTFLYGVRLGVDWPLGDSTWKLSSAIDYTVIELESDGLTLTDLDPLRIGVGVARRF
ncbi:MAG: outer membrane beta-barrel protein [Acidobacteriota bacterium]